MKKKARGKSAKPTTKELVKWLQSLRLHQAGSSEQAMIPGLDSYAPSYMSDGAVVGQREREMSGGQLEHYTQ